MAISYFGAAGIALVIAVIAGWGGAALPVLQLKRPMRWLWAMIAVVALTYTLFGIYKYDAWQYGLWDFGIYESIMHNMVTGGGMMVDFRGKFDHFSPVLLLLAPIYAIFRHGYVLVVVQALSMALAAWPLYRFAQHYFPRNNTPLLVAAIYLLNPYFSRLVLFDFHIECLFPLLFFSAFALYAARRWKFFLLLLACAPLIKEDFVVPVAACGLYFCCFTRRRTWGTILIAAALLWTVFVLKIYYPHLLGMEYWHYGRYELSGSSILRMMKQFFSVTSLTVLISVLLPAAFLPAAHWKSLLAILLPTIGIQLISTSFQQTLLADHYGSAVLAVVPVLAVFGLRTLRWKWRHRTFSPKLRRTAIFFVPALVVIVHVMFCDLVTVRHVDYLLEYQAKRHGGILSIPFGGEHWRLMMARDTHAALVKEQLPHFPEDLTVVAQNDIGMHFLRHCRVQALPGNFEADLYVFDQANVIDYRDNKRLEEVAANPAYTLVFHFDDVVIFQKKSTIRGEI